MRDDFDDFNPFKEMEEMIRRMNRHRSSRMTGFDNLKSGAREPRVDIRESDKEYKIVIELPGLDKKDIDLRVKANSLVIKTEVNSRKEDTKESTVYKEITSEQYYRSVPLPDNADAKNLSAKYNNGILEVTLPKINSLNSSRISIE